MASLHRPSSWTIVSIMVAAAAIIAISCHKDAYVKAPVTPTTASQMIRTTQMLGRTQTKKQAVSSAGALPGTIKGSATLRPYEPMYRGSNEPMPADNSKALATTMPADNSKALATTMARYKPSSFFKSDTIPDPPVDNQENGGDNSTVTEKTVETDKGFEAVRQLRRSVADGKGSEVVRQLRATEKTPGGSNLVRDKIEGARRVADPEQGYQEAAVRRDEKVVERNAKSLRKNFKSQKLQVATQSLPADQGH